MTTAAGCVIVLTDVEIGRYKVRKGMDEMHATIIATIKAHRGVKPGALLGSEWQGFDSTRACKAEYPERADIR